MAFKSCRLANLKTISKAHKADTKIQIFNGISESKQCCKRKSENKDSLIKIQLKKIDIPVETSTCALGNQYQKGHTDNFIPKPKNNNKYI